MKFLLDAVVAPDNRALEFGKQQSMTASADVASNHDNLPTISEGWSLM